MARLLLPLLLTFGLALSQASAQRSDIGLNPEHVSTYTKDKLFADALKQAEPISTPVDSNGWPTTDFTVKIGAPLWNKITDAPFGTNGNHGTYRVVFNGQAAISGASVTSQTYDAASNTTTAFINQTNPNDMSLTFSNTRRTSGSPTNTGVTNLRIMRPITAGSTTPHELHEVISRSFQQTMQPYGFIRAMDLTATNANPLVHWADRVRPGDPFQARSADGYGWQGRGIAFEYLILMANQTGKDLWICAPPRASDDFLLKLARLFRYGSDGVNPYSSPQSNPVWPPLAPERKLYIEIGNEFWNFGGPFAATHEWNNQQAQI
ncbi:MAG: hypothetical protein SNJ84_09350, partial [Verrucomicrobiia bacterium]